MPLASSLRRRQRRIFLLSAVLALCLSAGWWWRQTYRGPPRELAGVRLGLSVSDARAHFRVPTSDGVWTSRTDPDFVLQWEPAHADTGPLRRATLEFHQGMVVAVRLWVPGDAPVARGPAVDVSATAVLGRQPGGDGLTRVSLLSRSCPTHAAEVRALVAP